MRPHEESSRTPFSTEESRGDQPGPYLEVLSDAFRGHRLGDHYQVPLYGEPDQNLRTEVPCVYVHPDVLRLSYAILGIVTGGEIPELPKRKPRLLRLPATPSSGEGGAPDLTPEPTPSQHATRCRSPRCPPRKDTEC